MAVSERAAGLILALISVALAGAALTTDLARLSGGSFWGDGATYYTAAWSLAEDGDLRYEARDALRTRREFASGAQGIFLKRSSGGLRIDPEAGFPWVRRIGEDERRIYFAKPFTYPALAAPFVVVFGTSGLLVVNALSLALALILGYLELRRQASPGLALLTSVALFLLTITPVYLLWPTPEAMGVGLVSAALFAWRRGWVGLSAVLFGIATYSKPPNILLAAPLGFHPLLAGDGRLVRRLLVSLQRGAILAATAMVLYGANMAVTGEWNYQGGRERKTFYGVLPFEQQGVTFGNSGIWMSTNQVGPRIEGKDDVPLSQGAEPPRSGAELRTSFLWNLFYFWMGRFGGIVPYFLPFAVAALGFLAKPRDPVRATAHAGFLLSYLLYIWQIPDNWYGGSGTLGNRYFLNVLPLAVYFIPKGREWLVAVSGLVSAALLSAVLLAPMRHSMSPGEHTKVLPFRLFPAELSMLNDLSLFGETWRKKQSVGLTDPKPPAKGDPSAYYLYFMDDGAYGREENNGVLGFWLRAGAPGEVILRALEPVSRMNVRVTGGPRGDEVTIATGGRSQTVTVAAGETRETALEDLPRGFPYKDTFVHVLKLRSRRGGIVSGRSADSRILGAFVQIMLDVVPRAAPAAP